MSAPPRQPIASAPSAPHAPSAPSRPEGRSLLVADGDEARAKRIAEACARRGYAASLAADGSAALEVALTRSPDAVVAHLGLPLIGGAKLAEILDANPRTRAIPVLLVGEPGLGGDVPVAAEGDPEAVARRLDALLAAGERPGAGAREPGGVEGELGQLPLLDLLELFHASRRTGTVEVQRGREAAREVGQVFVRGGDVVAARAGAVEGEKALFRLLAWDRGRFRFEPGAVGLAQRIAGPTRSLLREGRRQLEEWGRLTVELPPLDAHVLRIGPERLPDAIHPLTREVLDVLLRFSRVRDVVDHSAHPDYQVLRTLHTLCERGLVELRADPAPGGDEPGMLAESQLGRLREWLARSQPGTPGRRDASLLVLAADAEAGAGLAERLAALPAFAPASPLPGPEDLALLGHLAVADDVGLELVQVPVTPRFAPLWPVAAHGALAACLVFREPSPPEALRAAAAALRAGGTRRVRVELPAPGARPRPGARRSEPPVDAESALVELVAEPADEARARLRELLGRLLP